METINWDDSFSVGIDILDQQHQKIISIINELLEQDEISVRSETLSNLLHQLTQYAHDHFITEEAILNKYGYEGLEKQKKDHKEYRLKVVNFCMDTVDHKKTVPLDLKAFILNWWKDHILIDDMSYKPFFEGLEEDVNESITEEFMLSIVK